MQSKSKWVYPFLLLCIGRDSHCGRLAFFAYGNGKFAARNRGLYYLKGGMQKAQQSPV